MSLRDFKKIYTVDKLIVNYDKVKSKLTSQYRKGPSIEDTKRLEKYLQNSIYGDPSVYQKILERASAMAKSIGNEQVKITLDKVKEGLTPNIKNVSGFNLKGRKITASNKVSSSLGGLEAKIKEIQGALDSFKKSNSISTTDIEKSLEEAINMINELFSTLGDKDVQINFDKDENWKATVDAINTIYKDFFIFAPVSNTDWGNAAEYVIASLSDEFLTLDEQTLTEQCTDYINDCINKVATGKSTSKIKSLLGKQGNQRTGIRKNEIVNKKIDVFGDKEYIIEIDGKSLDSFNPFAAEDKNAKMDINFTLPKKEQIKGTNNNFRISLKTQYDLKEFKTEHLAYSIVRIFDYNTLYNYSFNVEHDISTKIAQLSIIADALLGASQVTGYVDTLVYDDKQGHIKVFSLKEIVDKIENYYKGTNYNESDIKSLSKDFKKIFNNNNLTGSEKLIGVRNILKTKSKVFYYSQILANYKT